MGAHSSELESLARASSSQQRAETLKVHVGQRLFVQFVYQP